MAKYQKLLTDVDHENRLSSSRAVSHNTIGGRTNSDVIAPTDITTAVFEPNEPDLIRSWSAYATTVICLNAYPNGVTLSVHGVNKHKKNKVDAEDIVKPINLGYRPSQYHLRLRDTKDYLNPSGKYFLYKENVSGGLESKFASMREQGLLRSAVCYFGMVTDPFRAFHKKFNMTMACLEILERYCSGLLVVQTRCPMVIAALPTLKMLGDRAVVAIPIESCLEKVIARYTPGEAKISERLVAADGLRAQGIKVNLMASPILPYGNVYRDAWDFADLLDSHADYITFGCLASGSAQEESQLKSLPIAQKLVVDKQYRYLRPHAYRNLYYALKVLAPEKLLLPVQERMAAAQLDLFAAA